MLKIKFGGIIPTTKVEVWAKAEHYLSIIDDFLEAVDYGKPE
jgi:hypothetical protein